MASGPWPRYFADPCVIKAGDRYYAYGTDGPDCFARAETGREFPVLWSADLERWEFAGGALDVPNEMADLAFWAPEVVEKEGHFHLYFSAGGQEGQEHKLRVAVADSPTGPFRGDKLPLLPKEPFSIDGHPFQDPVSGQWYLFFAKDFFDEPVGTGLAAVVLSNDLLRVASEPITILRAQADWQIFERNRLWYDRVWPSWHCVEGAFVVHRDGRYWLFYSGGRWEAANYGVGCAVADHVTGPYKDPNVAEGPSVLKTHDPLFGPGHNSVVSGPDGEDRICFHAWDSGYSARRLHIAPLRWTRNGPIADV